MTLIDLNLLIHIVNVDFPEQPRARAWWEDLLRRGERIGLPWMVIVGFVRITTNPRAMKRPFTLPEALAQVDDWLALPGVVVVHPTGEHARHFAGQCLASGATGNLVSDAHLAALAIEHGCELASNDADYGRFPTLRWVNPLRAE